MTIPVPFNQEVAVIIPAHDESAVIDACLNALTHLADSPSAQIIVACNGCRDDTAERARAFPFVDVIETATPSKTTALNLGDSVARQWPRIYLDADVLMPALTVTALTRALMDEGVLAARPAYRFNTGSGGKIIRAYYRARTRTTFHTTALWGAGVYALNEQGHRRLGRFPNVVADDLHVHSLFHPSEIRIVDDAPVEVRVPTTLRDTVRVGRRIRRGNTTSGLPLTQAGTTRQLLRSSRSVRDWADTVVYLAIGALIRLTTRASSAERWERDESTRTFN